MLTSTGSQTVQPLASSTEKTTNNETQLTSSHNVNPYRSRDQSSPFLSLPPEIRHQILTLLFPPHRLKALVIRSLFIRTHYRNIYMTTMSKSFMTNSLTLLRVCHQLTAECLTLLYRHPTWRCATRLNELGSQIGINNVNLIRRMEVGYEDLDSIAERCKHAHNTSINKSYLLNNSNGDASLRFTALEILETEGYQAGATSTIPFDTHQHTTTTISTTLQQYSPSITTIHPSPVLTLTPQSKHRLLRTETLSLLLSARTILTYHPLLSVLVQSGPRSTGGGGADAIDLTMGRVRWRFLSRRSLMGDDEVVVDLDAVIAGFGGG